MFTCCRIHNSGLKLWNYNWHRRISVEERTFAAKRKECSQCAAGKYSIAKHFTNAQSLPQNGNQEIFPPRGRFCLLFFFFFLCLHCNQNPRQGQSSLRTPAGPRAGTEVGRLRRGAQGLQLRRCEIHLQHLRGGREQHGRSRICPDNWDASARGAC